MGISKQYVNIIFDAMIIIGCAVVALFVSVLTLALMFFSRTIREKDRINSLLTANPFMSLVIVSLFTLDIYIYTFYGYIHPNNSFDE